MAEDDRQGADLAGEGAGEPHEPAEAEVKRVKAEAARANADKLKAEADKATAEIQKLEAETELKNAEAAVARASADTVKLKAEADKAIAEIQKLKAKTELKKAEAEGTRADENTKLAKEMNQEAAAGPGIRDFVRQSLLDIMAGVDDAAAMGKTRELNEGLTDYLPAVTMIGTSSADERASDRVEFDLAVTVAQSASEQKGKGGTLDASFKVGVMGLGKLHVGASGHIERTVGEASSSQRANRLRFSVPIVYAVQDDSADEE